jgi:selenocysteine lyase/cysteine desulfurase
MAAPSAPRSFTSRGYVGIGSFQIDETVDEMLMPTASEYRAPARAVSDADLWDASSPAPALGCSFKSSFFIDPAWTFLNHGAFGGASRVALRSAQRWAEYCESQPLRYIDRELFPLLVASVRALALLVHAPQTSIALVPNATYALTSTIRSVPLAPGDVVFCLDVGYGSVRTMLADAATRVGARLVVGAVAFPLTTPEALVAAVAPQIPRGAALCVFDHITSNAGLLLPVAELVSAARARGARAVLVDGAHGLGALDLDIPSIGANFYVSNAHKWLCSAKGLGMLYVSPDVLDPVRRATTRAPGPPRAAAVSHGYGNGFASEFIWDGCRDYGAAVALPSLLGWWNWIGLDRARAHCRTLLREGCALLCARWGTGTHAPWDFYSHMACVQLPARALPPGSVDERGVFSCTSTHGKMIQDALHFGFSVEVPAKTLSAPEGDTRTYVRVSAMVYNGIEDFTALADAVDRIAWDAAPTQGALPILRVLPSPVSAVAEGGRGYDAL